MRVFKTKNFKRWQRREKLSDNQLYELVKELMNGLFDAYLGCGLYKKRWATQSGGKRAGYRIIVAYEKLRVIFLLGYAKNEKIDLDIHEEYLCRKLSHYYLNLSLEALESKKLAEEIMEINNEAE